MGIIIWDLLLVSMETALIHLRNWILFYCDNWFTKNN